MTFFRTNRYDEYLRALDENERHTRISKGYWTKQILGSWYDEFYLGEVRVGTPREY